MEYGPGAARGSQDCRRAARSKKNIRKLKEFIRFLKNCEYHVKATPHGGRGNKGKVVNSVLVFAKIFEGHDFLIWFLHMFGRLRVYFHCKNCGKKRGHAKNLVKMYTKWASGWTHVWRFKV